MSIRPAQLTDLPYLYDICLKTGLDGQDATAVLKDPFMVGHYFAAPYLFFEPDACFVAEIDHQLAGYVIGTSDTVAFNRWFNAEWIPQLRQKYPRISDPSDLEKFLFEIIHEGANSPDFCDDYPAHLHIDLLPSAQGHGLGRQLIETFTDAMKQKQVSGIHLGVSLANSGACRFYDRVNFVEIERLPGASYRGLKL